MPLDQSRRSIFFSNGPFCPTLPPSPFLHIYTSSAGVFCQTITVRVHTHIYNVTGDLGWKILKLGSTNRHSVGQLLNRMTNMTIGDNAVKPIRTIAPASYRSWNDSPWKFYIFHIKMFFVFGIHAVAGDMRLHNKRNAHVARVTFSDRDSWHKFRVEPTRKLALHNRWWNDGCIISESVRDSTVMCISYGSHLCIVPRAIARR